MLGRWRFLYNKNGHLFKETRLSLASFWKGALHHEFFPGSSWFFIHLGDFSNLVSCFLYSTHMFFFLKFGWRINSKFAPEGTCKSTCQPTKNSSVGHLHPEFGGLRIMNSPSSILFYPPGGIPWTGDMIIHHMGHKIWVRHVIVIVNVWQSNMELKTAPFIKRP